jgi:hypothetical protein
MEINERENDEGISENNRLSLVDSEKERKKSPDDYPI